MPCIEVTPEQYAEYQAGASIKKPEPEVKYFIVVRNDGGIFEYSTIDGQPQPWTVVRNSKSVTLPLGEKGMSYDFTNNGSFDTIIPFDPTIIGGVTRV